MAITIVVLSTLHGAPIPYPVFQMNAAAKHRNQPEITPRRELFPSGVALRK